MKVLATNGHVSHSKVPQEMGRTLLHTIQW